MPTQATLSREFREALRPFLRRLISDKTLSLGKLGVLSHLSEHGRATSSELAIAQQISPQAITVAVRELEALKLVGRTPDQDDRRKIWIELTDSGRTRLEHELGAGNSWFDDAIATRLSEDEQATLRAAIPVLRRLTSEPFVE